MLKQQHRIGQLATPLGENVLALAEFHGSEGLSELFDFKIEAVSEQEDIDFDKLLGKGCSIAVNLETFGKRAFHGIAVDASWLGMRYDLHIYQLTLRPWLWLLGKTTDCRIFHDKSAVDIIKDVFTRRGFADFRFVTTAKHPVLHYTVQYRESDLNFVCRLMEQHGIYYFFEHSADAHILVLADARTSHKPAPDIADIKFVPLGDASRNTRQPHVYDWRSDRALRSGKIELNDYNHLKPNSQMLAHADANRQHTHGKLEVFEHPGVYTEKGDGSNYAKIRMEAEQAGDRNRVGGGLALTLFPGSTVKLAKHPRASENTDWLVTHVDHYLARQNYRSGGESSAEPYSSSYRFLKADQQFRAPLITPKPLVQSLQTALVTGAAGEEIDCDDHGRILVHFYWDRHNDKSCRVRVNQVWGSKTWGAQIIPRIGMEVMVAYIDGDPDRPIIVGTVPDPQNNHVPYKLPDHKSRMVWRSNSYMGKGFNELSFEDKAGGENFLLHAQKDFTQKVLNNATHRVDNSSAVSVGQHASSEIGGNHNSEVGGSQTNVVGATGAGVMAALAPLAGLMGQTAGLAGEAAGLAGGVGAIQQLAMGVVAQAAQALLGATGGGGGGRGGVVGGGTTRGDMGTALASAGTQLLQGVGQMFGQAGVQKNIISQAQITAVGQMATETVGTTKVTHVGSTYFTQVGKKMKIEVGEELEIVVGKSHLVMRKDGSVILNGVRFVFTASGPVEVYGEVIDLNKPG